jgi:hypothetical protein
MAKHISQLDLQEFYRNEIRNRGEQEVERIVKDTKVDLRDRKKRKSVFLSHSHLDKTVVSKISLLFNSIDYDIYVDWMDRAMPKVTDKNTALLIKEKIQHCHKFLFLATARGLQSKWCDWEVGVAYSIKKESQLAILPIESKSGRWKGSEYLALLPEMEFDVTTLENLDAHKVKIRYSPSRAVSLEKWLDSNN